MKRLVLSLACLAWFVACDDESANYDWNDSATLSVKLTNGKFTDDRDGQKYSVVQVNGQLWMSENLRYSDSSKTPNLKGNMWCHEDDGDCEKYGPLYSWTAAMNLESKYNSSSATYTYDYTYGVHGICPENWRLPTVDDWQNLAQYLMFTNGGDPIGADMKAVEGWEDEDNIPKALNRSGFAALPAGRRNSEGGFMSAGKYAFFWSSAQVDAATSSGWTLRYDNAHLDNGNYYKDHGMSVRCVLAMGTESAKIEGDVDSSYLDNIPFDYGQMEIDGKSYKTIKIGTQNWMAENAAVKTDDSWCYNDDEKNCDKYGRLYSFEAAQTVCPAGWRLPTKSDFQTIYGAVGFGSSLRSRDGWTDKGSRGTNYMGFNAMPAGGRESGDYFDVTYSSYMWGSDKSVLWLRYYDEKISIEEKDAKNAFSVRCIEE